MPFISEDPIFSVVIAGAGGFGLEIFDYINEEIKNGGPAIAGFIDDTPGGKIPEGIDLPCLGTIGDFKPEPGQIVIVALGSAKGRRIVLEKLWANQVKTPAYYHSSAVLSPAAKLNRGVVVCPFSIVNRNAILDKGSVLNVHCSVGHGAFVGAYSVLSPYAALNGDAKIGSACFLGTRATIYPRVSIGDDCIVDTNTGVRSNTENKKMITSRGDYKVLNIRV
ncbi:acetyltransferase [Iodobacter sp. LRB]|uniref:acetyltransferase n=1 Tax=unclassified Iodobacter TaxID=235634 RepID=UPI000C101025|nr:acetyltransferase [Iodobacter sp. BJB302]PHV03475.1 transferase [Iodobacter sp. BJB302]